MNIMLNRRLSLILRLGAGLGGAILLSTSTVHAQSPADPAPHASAPGRHGGGPLMTKDLVGLSDKEVVMSTIDVAPGASSPPHRHDAQVFVYVLQGTMIMQVKGGPRMTLHPGETFYESPSDIHTVSENASKTEPAKFLAILIKDKNKPATVMVH